MDSEDVKRHLEPMRAEYERVMGKPFRRFYCPLLCREEDGELCMGHVISKTWPNCCRATVVQGGEIDHWYGSIAEAEFGTMLKARSVGLPAIVFDKTNNKLRGLLKPKIFVDGAECRYYPYKEGKSSPSHTHIELAQQGANEVVRLVLVKSPQEMIADQSKQWGFVVDRDWRLPMLVSVIKAAYLTLFRMLGYSYALSSCGLDIGRYTLGKFYEDNKGKSLDEVRAAATSFFKPYRHIVRPATEFGGEVPRGTIEDNRVAVCLGSSGRPWAMMVFVRVDQDIYAVLMPAFNNVDSLDAYRSFRQTDEDCSLNISWGIFRPENQDWEVCDKSARAFWPRASDTFDLERTFTREDDFGQKRA